MTTVGEVWELYWVIGHGVVVRPGDRTYERWLG